MMETGWRPLSSTLSDEQPLLADSGNSSNNLPEPTPAATEEEFRCEEHNKTFKSKQGLSLHMTRAHGATPVRPRKPRVRPGIKSTPEKPQVQKVAKAEFNQDAALATISSGYIPAKHFGRVTDWLKETEALFTLLRG